MALKPIEYIKGAKNKHPTVRCICDCGGERIVRATRLKNGIVTMCAKCAHKEGAKKGSESRKKFSEVELILRGKYSVYKCNANRKKIDFNISVDDFKKITSLNCIYCGIDSGIGIDRIDSGAGYILENCAPCCSDCNYAKRNMSRDSFISLIVRIYNHQNALSEHI